MNKSEAKYQEKQTIFALIDPDSFNEEANNKPMTEEELRKELFESDEAIAECHDMFLYAKEVGNKEEMAFWRSQEQENKTAKRLMRENFYKEVAAA